MCRLSEALGCAGWLCETCGDFVKFHGISGESGEITIEIWKKHFSQYPYLNHEFGSSNYIAGNGYKRADTDHSHYAGMLPQSGE